MNKKYIKRQIKYFTNRHNKVKSLKDKLFYSNCLYFWENKFKNG